MTAHDLKLSDAAICAEIEQCIGFLSESNSRRRIATAWANGWIVGDDAMGLLLDLELIEAPRA